MKRYILTLILAIVATCCIAQHLTFMGIPMGKKIVDFKSQLALKGFKTVNQNNNTYRMAGYFNGFNVTVDIETTPKTKLVYRVAVIFNDYIINTKDDEIIKTSQMSI